MAAVAEAEEGDIERDEDDWTPCGCKKAHEPDS